MKRRKFIKNTVLGTAGVLYASQGFSNVQPPATDIAGPPFKLPFLDYTYEALEPFIDAKTMEIHHSKHHQAYVDNLNKELAKEGEVRYSSIDALCMDIQKYSTKIRNNAGGHYNHSFFWKQLRVSAIAKPTDKFAQAIVKQYGDIEKFMLEVTNTGMKIFGSGWIWVVVNNKKEIEIGSLPNQDNPLMNLPEIKLKGTPVLAIDVWEHAYYLKHQNNRAQYLKDIMSVVNWEFVNKLYLDAF